MIIQNVSLNTEDRKLLLDLAKEAIESKLERREIKIPKNIPSKLKEKRGTFVTLTINGQLRGCIGHILPVQELYKDVIENARSAALDDPRFPPLTKEELPNVKIEISILDLPKKLKYESPQMLIDYLNKTKPGVILKKGSCRATFLPQVWEEVKEPEEFLAHLCLKAGLQADEWTRTIEIETYKVEKINGA
jgi:AmmeMemoRadiSam system protein A